MKKTMLKCLALLSVMMFLYAPMASAAQPDTGDLIKFVPTKVTVKSREVTVEGYFVNMNENYIVKNFREFEMDVYKDGELLVSGEFGTINQFSIYPLRMKFQSFTFKGSHSLNTGTYVANDGFYCKVSMRFTSQEY